MKVGFLGIQCDNANLGVSALAYAGIHLVHGVTPPQAEFVIFSDNSSAGIDRMRRDLGIEEREIRALAFRHKDPRRLTRSIREIHSCDFIVDFTGGDSFSDIYGPRRITKLLLHKEMAILGRTPLVLAPQTYGPFRRRAFLPWVRHVLRGARLVFARDTLSADYLATLVSREVVLTTDVAVTLPWNADPTPEVADSRTTRVGFNVSGLLWSGGYTGDNQFGLKTDYRSYCDRVVGALLEAGLDVELVSHVQLGARAEGEGDGEDDVAAARALQSLHPGARLGPGFASPVEAKSHIAGCDVFIGSRMHATIAAFTAGVPTVPVAYSRKFAGFFGSLGYDAVVDLTELDTDESVELTLRYVADRESLSQSVAVGNAEAQRRIQVFPERMREFVDGLRRR